MRAVSSSTTRDGEGEFYRMSASAHYEVEQTKKAANNRGAAVIPWPPARPSQIHLTGTQHLVVIIVK
jgi:hypothetical protein